MYMYTYIHTYMFMYINICIYINIYIRIYAKLNTHVYVSMQVPCAWQHTAQLAATVTRACLSAETPSRPAWCVCVHLCG